jgi:nucleoside-diphosphate-sugar epimerase
MRILIAGASGAIGRPLVRRLRANQHEIFALTRPPGSARFGEEPVIADALDAVAVKAAVGRIRPDAVINELTSLPRHYTPAEMRAAAERDHKVRVECNTNLLAALHDAGVRRYLLQSSRFWYEPGAGLADESVPFISSATPGVEASARTYLGIGSARIRDTGNRIRRATLRILLRPRHLVHARGRYWRSGATPAGSDYRSGPGGLQLRAYR